MSDDPSTAPVTDADLHAFADSQLPLERHAAVHTWLQAHPEDARRVADWRAQKALLRCLFDPVLDEPLPAPLREAARGPRGALHRAWRLAPVWQAMAAGLALVLLGGGAGWGLRGAWPGQVGAGAAPLAGADAPGAAFANRAAVAHVVYAPEQKRPVEVDAAHEAQLVTWLTKRLGAEVRVPQLQALGYALEGGRLLPGARGPVAQFMYRDAAGGRLTLYVSNDLADVAALTGGGATPSPSPAANAETRFRFVREGRLQVFYWVDGPFGYALTADADRARLVEVSALVWQQLRTR